MADLYSGHCDGYKQDPRRLWLEFSGKFDVEYVFPPTVGGACVGASSLSEVGSDPFPHATPVTINAATAMIAANPLIPIAIANSFLAVLGNSDDCLDLVWLLCIYRRRQPPKGLEGQ